MHPSFILFCSRVLNAKSQVKHPSAMQRSGIAAAVGSGSYSYSYPCSQKRDAVGMGSYSNS
jgi:hypothetical protein